LVITFATKTIVGGPAELAPALVIELGAQPEDDPARRRPHDPHVLFFCTAGFWFSADGQSVLCSQMAAPHSAVPVLLGLGPALQARAFHEQADILLSPDFADDFPVAMQAQYSDREKKKKKNTLLKKLEKVLCGGGSAVLSNLETKTACLVTCDLCAPWLGCRHRCSVCQVRAHLRDHEAGAAVRVDDLETATAVYRNRISPDPIFLACDAPGRGGFYAVNRRGQVLPGHGQRADHGALRQRPGEELARLA